MEERKFKPREIVRKVGDDNVREGQFKSGFIVFFLVLLFGAGMFYYSYTLKQKSKDITRESSTREKEAATENQLPEEESESDKQQEDLNYQEDTSITDANQAEKMVTGRPRAQIMRVVMQNLAALRYAYNKRLRTKPGLKGRITVKFAIDEYGKVIFCKVVSSTVNDKVLEDEVVRKVERWVFPSIDKPGDITEVVYPFVFSQ